MQVTCKKIKLTNLKQEKSVRFFQVETRNGRTPYQQVMLHVNKQAHLPFIKRLELKQMQQNKKQLD